MKVRVTVQPRNVQTSTSKHDHEGGEVGAWPSFFEAVALALRECDREHSGPQLRQGDYVRLEVRRL